MQTGELISGYADLLRQFKDRTGTTTDALDIEIMFFLEDYDLIADEEKTACSMVLAIFNPKSDIWRYELLPGSRGRKLIQYFCEETDVEQVPGALNTFFAF